MLGLSRYQWAVLFAAWLGWGFDVFDGLLFNYVAPNCVPTLLHLTIGSPEAKSATLFWNGLMTSILLVGWAVGGVVFGHICDRIGRTRTMLLTMALYALGTAACALAPNIWVLALCRVVAALGIGGEWAAGASMVAEVVPEKRRVEAGALLYTAAPMGMFLATYVNFGIAGVLFKDDPSVSWRYVFLFGLIPAVIAFIVRIFLKEPERWQHAMEDSMPPHLREIFSPEHRRATMCGVAMAVIALISWWSCNAFIPVVSTGLAQAVAETQHLEKSATLALVEAWKFRATFWFNMGGLIGTLLTIPVAKLLGRKPLFAIYFTASALSFFATFGLDLDPGIRLYLYFLIGLSVTGVFGSFTYYLPELFPTRLRGTGAGFCYNIGRVFAAAGPFIVGAIASHGTTSAIQTLFYLGFVPLAGLLLIPLVIETRGKVLAD